MKRALILGGGGASGAFEVHSRDTGAPLAKAIASSCAVPGMFPPVTVAGSDFMDGGVRSATSAEVAQLRAAGHARGLSLAGNEASLWIE